LLPVSRTVRAAAVPYFHVHCAGAIAQIALHNKAVRALLRFELPGPFAKRGAMLGQPLGGPLQWIAVDATQPEKWGVLFSPF